MKSYQLIIKMWSEPVRVKAPITKHHTRRKFNKAVSLITAVGV
jgi:hypothetical protein